MNVRFKITQTGVMKPGGGEYAIGCIITIDKSNVLALAGKGYVVEPKEKKLVTNPKNVKGKS